MKIEKVSKSEINLKQYNTQMAVRREVKGEKTDYSMIGVLVDADLD